MKALIVDDSSTIRKILRNNLIKLGLSDRCISEAIDGISALRCISSDKEIEFVITDLQMPNMSGIEFIKRVRMNRKEDELAIVVISSFFDRENKIVLEKLGVHGYINKPFNAEMFKEVVSPIISKENDDIADKFEGTINEFNLDDVKRLIQKGAKSVFIDGKNFVVDFGEIILELETEHILSLAQLKLKKFKKEDEKSAQGAKK